jgi:cell division protein FtsI/penicillin-binding protein 2
VHSNNYRRRFDGVFFLFLFFLAFCIARLFIIQFLRSGMLADQAKKQHSLLVELEPRRGTIYDIALRPQAVNTSVDSLYASPVDMPESGRESVIKLVSRYALTPLWAERLSRRKSSWLARKLPSSTVQQIKNLKIVGRFMGKQEVLSKRVSGKPRHRLRRPGQHRP